MRIRAVLALVITTFAFQLPAQTRPAGPLRVWADVGVEANVQTQGCRSCLRNGNAAGPAISWALGTSLPAHFGIAIAGRNFQEFNFEHTQHSRYLLVLGQYAPSLRENLTLNIGAGRAKHDADHGDAYRNSANGAVVSGGAALRFPASGRAAFTVNGNILKSVGRFSGFRPTTFTLGIGFNLSAQFRNHN